MSTAEERLHELRAIAEHLIKAERAFHRFDAEGAMRLANKEEIEEWSIIGLHSDNIETGLVFDTRHPHSPIALDGVERWEVRNEWFLTAVSRRAEDHVIRLRVLGYEMKQSWMKSPIFASWGNFNSFLKAVEESIRGIESDIEVNEQEFDLEQAIMGVRITRPELARILGVQSQTLRNWDKKGYVPTGENWAPGIKVSGNLLLYSVEENIRAIRAMDKRHSKNKPDEMQLAKKLAEAKYDRNV